METERFDYERLMSRRLDGVITEQEGAALDRALLRDPELRKTFETYQRIDALAAEALTREVNAEDRAVDVDAAMRGPQRVIRFRRMHRGWLLIPGAIAAALLATVVPFPRLTQPERPAVVHMNRPSPPMSERNAHDGFQVDGLYRNVGLMQRRTGRELIGVLGEDGKIYWIEVDRTRNTSRLQAPSWMKGPRL